METRSIPFLANLLAASLCLAACGGGEGSDESQTSLGETLTTTTSSTAEATGDDSMSSEASSTDDTTGVDTTDDSSETGNDGPNACDQLIECVQTVEPSGSTAVIAAYGPEGSCWATPGVSEEDCILECFGLLSGWHDTFPEISACYECAADSDCLLAAEPWCDASAGGCQNWTNCTPDGEPCPEGWSCQVEILFDPATEVQLRCLPSEGLVGPGEPCTSGEGNQGCSSSICATSDDPDYPAAPDCPGDPVFGLGCCLGMCDVTDANSCADQPGSTCAPWPAEGGSIPSPDDLGFCVWL